MINPIQIQIQSKSSLNPVQSNLMQSNAIYQNP